LSGTVSYGIDLSPRPFCASEFFNISLSIKNVINTGNGTPQGGRPHP